jgi:hypothetical protein
MAQSQYEEEAERLADALRAWLRQGFRAAYLAPDVITDVTRAVGHLVVYSERFK